MDVVAEIVKCIGNETQDMDRTGLDRILHCSCQGCNRRRRRITQHLPTATTGCETRVHMIQAIARNDANARVDFFLLLAKIVSVSYVVSTL